MNLSGSRRKYILITGVIVLLSGLCLPQPFMNPVEGATQSDYNLKSFWFYPWGKSGTHKGVDIFAAKGTPVRASVSGLVIYKGDIERGGKVILLLGPKWRLHYYAHLQDNKAVAFSMVKKGTRIGTVGTTGNAKNKPPHLHYSILSLVPYVWKADLAKEGWKKMFYLNPVDFLQGCE